MRTLKGAPEVSWRKLNDRFQTGICDLMWCVRGTRVSGLAEAKVIDLVSRTGKERRVSLTMKKSQGPWMDAAVRDGWRVALILGLGGGSVGVLRELPGVPARFTRLGLGRFTMRDLVQLQMVYMKSYKQIETVLYE